MKMSLTLTGSSAALAAAMTAFESVEGNAGGVRSTPTGAGIPVAPVSIPSPPSGAATIPAAPIPNSVTISHTAPDGDEGDDVDDGTGDSSGVDADGLPWDERIHSSNKKRSGDGRWMSRRGGPKGEERAAIEAEIRAGGTPAPAMPAPVAPVAPVPLAPVAPPPPMPQPVAEAPAPVMAPPPAAIPAPLPSAGAPVPMAPTTPAPLPMPVAAPEPTPPVTAAPMQDFGQLMGAYGPKMSAVPGDGLMTQEYLAQVCQLYGITALADLAAKPELIPQIVAQFNADGFTA